MKIARVFLLFFAIIFGFASLGFYLYIFFTPLWDMSLRMIPLYLYPSRMFLILSILLIALVVVMSKKSFDEKEITKVCISACAVMVCMGIGTTVFAHKDYKDFTFRGLAKVDYSSSREKYVPYNYLFEMDDSQESEYYMQHKGSSLASHVYVDNYFAVSTDSELSYGAEFFKSDNEFLRFKFNAEKINPLFEEPINSVLTTVGESNEKDGIKYAMFVNEDDYAVKIAEHDEVFYIYLLNAKKHGVTEDDFVKVAVEQYGLLRSVPQGDGNFLLPDEK